MIITLVRRLIESILPYTLLRFAGFIYGYWVSKSVSFSQKGEDLLSVAYFAKRGIKQGVYLDIGCFHPVWISNTHLLHKQGWLGHAVDIDDFKQFDLVLDTTQLTSEEVFGKLTQVLDPFIFKNHPQQLFPFHQIALCFQ